MSDGTTMTLEGADTLKATTAVAIAGIERPDAAQAAAGRLIAQRAAAKAPKSSGALARSIRADASGDEVSIGSDLIYAGVQEFGWGGHNIAAHPFMRPALTDSADTVARLYADDVQHELGTIRGA